VAQLTPYGIATGLVTLIAEALGCDHNSYWTLRCPTHGHFAIVKLHTTTRQTATSLESIQCLHCESNYVARRISYREYTKLSNEHEWQEKKLGGHDHAH